MEVGVDVFLYGVADPVFKKDQSFPSLLCENQMSAVAHRTGFYHSGIGQLAENLLESQETCIFPFQQKVTDLSSCKRKAHTIEHVKYNEFIQSKGILKQSVFLLRNIFPAKAPFPSLACAGNSAHLFC